MNYTAVAKAKRRLAAEQGAVVKDWGGRFAIALVYANRYSVGMSSLGFQTVYALANANSAVVCERVFCEAEDDPSHGPISIEGQRPLGDFAAIAFSISFELDYFRMVTALRQAGIPLLSSERSSGHPLIIVGGPVGLANPEPIAPFVDAFVIGEAEPVLPAMLDVLLNNATNARDDLFAELASLPGVYVPSLYRQVLAKDGTLEAIEPIARTAQTLPIVRQHACNLADFATTSTILTDECELSGMYLIEVARGCTRGCRFCLAAYGFLPMRERPLGALLDQAREGLRVRKRIGLVGAAVSDYSRIDDLVEGLRTMGAGVAVSSLRVDSLTDSLLRSLVESGAQTLTLAPEAGSARLRAIINKGLTEDHFTRAIEAVASYRLQRLKLYFMIGLPGESHADIEAIITLVSGIKHAMELQRRRPTISIKLSPFVPKAQTPFESVAMLPLDELNNRVAIVKRGLRQLGVTVKADSPQWATVEAVLARGDRRVASVLQSQKGGSWSDWQGALSASGVDDQRYLNGLTETAVRPWHSVSTGINPQYLTAELRRANEATLTPPCPTAEVHCVRCGVCRTIYPQTSLGSDR